MSERVVLRLGATVAADGRHYRMHQVLDLETVLVHDSQTGELKRLKIGDLTLVALPAETSPSTGGVDLVGISDVAWKTAQERFAVIRPLLSTPRCTRAQVAACARLAGVTTATLSRWLQRYQQSGRVSALIPAVSSGGRGQGRLRRDAEAIVQATIEDVYLSRQKPSVQQVCVEGLRRCRNAGLSPPHPNTVRSRICHLADNVRLPRREGSHAAAAKYAPLQGAFPGAAGPLSVVQIDHTPVDLILVDDLHRRPVGRPWLTLAIDVFSRVVYSYLADNSDGLKTG